MKQRYYHIMYSVNNVPTVEISSVINLPFEPDYVKVKCMNTLTLGDIENLVIKSDFSGGQPMGILSNDSLSIAYPETKFKLNYWSNGEHWIRFYKANGESYTIDADLLIMLEFKAK